VDNFFPLLYFGPTEYYRQIANCSEPFWCVHERYCKQTLRNRCDIYGANGKIRLSVPVQRPRGKESLVSEAKIAYAEPWQQIHWRSIKSAYGRTPFFEYFEYKFEPLFKRKFDLLVDFLLETNGVICELMKINRPQILSELVNTELQMHLDNRTNLAAYITEETYIQIFEDRHGFIPNLSILDRLFHLGNRW
jgi:hypothetical protein